jgi:hypothetical protein
MNKPKMDYEGLMASIEAERLRVRAIPDRGSYGSEHFRVVTPEFAKQCTEEALVRGSAELCQLSPTEARMAGKILETELKLRETDERRETAQYVKFTLWAAIAAAIFALLALLI